MTVEAAWPSIPVLLHPVRWSRAPRVGAILSRAHVWRWYGTDKELRVVAALFCSFVVVSCSRWAHDASAVGLPGVLSLAMASFARLERRCRPRRLDGHARERTRQLPERGADAKISLDASIVIEIFEEEDHSSLKITDPPPIRILQGGDERDRSSHLLSRGNLVYLRDVHVADRDDAGL